MRSTQIVSLFLAASSAQAIKPGCADAKWNSATDYWGTKWTASEGNEPLYPITYNNTFVTIKNRPLRYVVLYCTNEPPPVSEIGGFALAIKVPVKSVAALDGLSQNIIDMLGMSHSIARVGELSTVTSPCVRGNMADNVTYDEARWSSARAVDVTFSGDSSTVDPTKIVLTNDGSLGPLQLASYIRFVGMFYGLDELALQIYNNIATNYRCTAARVNEIVQKKQYPIGHFISAVSHEGSNFKVAQGIWWKILANDAGVQLVDATDNQAVSKDVSVSSSSGDTALAKQSWGLIDTTQYNVLSKDATRLNKESWLSSSGVSASTFAIAKDNVFLSDKTFNPSNRNNFQDLAPARPDLVINDLISMIYPSFNPSYTTSFLRSVSNPAEITDLRRLRNVCVTAGKEISSLELTTCALAADTVPLQSAGLLVNAYGRVVGVSDALPSWGGLTTAQKIGIAVGSVGAVLILSALAAFFVMRRRARMLAEVKLLEKTRSVESLESGYSVPATKE